MARAVPRRMLRSQLLRQTLVELVLVAAAIGCEGGRAPDIDASEPFDPCSVNNQTLVKVEPEPPSAALLELVRACEADQTKCDALCRQILDDEGLYSHALKACTVTHTSTEHTITVGYCFIGAEGRRPAGLAGARKRCASVASGHLARAAFYEAASVHAFVQLARELRRHRAPRTLVTAVRRAAAEEIDHARSMSALARARGSVPPPVEVAPPRRRSIEALAIENAREGLVGETWSAMIALWQSVHAPDAQLRATYARIAEDEIRHAELARELDRWARSRLAPAACKRVETARSEALAALSRQVRRAPHRALVAELGMPDGTAASKLFDDARAALLS